MALKIPVRFRGRNPETGKWLYKRMKAVGKEVREKDIRIRRRRKDD